MVFGGRDVKKQGSRGDGVLPPSLLVLVVKGGLGKQVRLVRLAPRAKRKGNNQQYAGFEIQVLSGAAEMAFAPSCSRFVSFSFFLSLLSLFLLLLAPTSCFLPPLFLIPLSLARGWCQVRRVGMKGISVLGRDKLGRDSFLRGCFVERFFSFSFSPFISPFHVGSFRLFRRCRFFASSFTISLEPLGAVPRRSYQTWLTLVRGVASVEFITFGIAAVLNFLLAVIPHGRDALVTMRSLKSRLRDLCS